MVWYTLVAIIWKPAMLYLQTKCIMYSSYSSYYQLVAVHSQWTVQTLQTDSQKLVSSKLMKARKLNCSFSCPNKGPLCHICCRTLLWSQSLWAWISIKPLLVSKDTTDFFPVREGFVLSYCMGNLMFFEASTVDASNYSNSEGRRRKERFESSFISVFKTLLATLTQ